MISDVDGARSKSTTEGVNDLRTTTKRQARRPNQGYQFTIETREPHDGFPLTNGVPRKGGRVFSDQ